MKVVWGGALVGRLALFPLPPLLSDDAYRYIWDGLLQLAGLNPYLYLPSDQVLASFQELWVYPLLNSASYYTVYPPVSQFVFALGALFFEPGSLTSFYVIKAVIVAFDLGIVYLLSRIVSPGAVMLYAWHPLILLEFAGQGHQEAMMAFFLVLSYWFLRRDRRIGSVTALTLAGWVKLYPFFLMPFLLRRVGWRRVWAAVVVSVLVWIPYAHPAVIENMLQSLQLYVQLFEYNAGPYYAAKQLMYWLTGVDWSKTIGPIFAGTFLSIGVGAYIVDRWIRWPWAHLIMIVLGSYFALATTVHPWYLTGLLAIIPLLQRKTWHWIWLATWSIGTYLFYVGGPYWTFIWIGWGGWFVGLLVYHHHTLLDWLLRLRAYGKWRYIEPHLPGDMHRLLDLGAGEGYVGRLAADETEAFVQGADVHPLNKTELPYTVYDGHKLPFEDGAFDAAMLVYVLHHARRPEQVIAEALRISKKRVIILESVYETTWDRRVLRLLDRAANGLRFRGRREGKTDDLHFRTAEEWARLLKQHGRLVVEERFGHFPHKKALFVVEVTNGPE